MPSFIEVAGRWWSLRTFLWTGRRYGQSRFKLWLVGVLIVRSAFHGQRKCESYSRSLDLQCSKTSIRRLGQSQSSLQDKVKMVQTRRHIGQIVEMIYFLISKEFTENIQNWTELELLKIHYWFRIDLGFLSKRLLEYSYYYSYLSRNTYILTEIFRNTYSNYLGNNFVNFEE